MPYSDGLRVFVFTFVDNCFRGKVVLIAGFGSIISYFGHSDFVRFLYFA